MNIPLSAISIGQAAALIQRMPNQISEAAKQLEIQPVLRLNMVDHYSEADLERIRDFIGLSIQRRQPPQLTTR